MLKSAKRAVYDQFKNVDVNDEEPLLPFSGAQGFINLRYLTYQSAYAHDVSPITPNYLLFGKLGGQFVPEEGEWI